MKKKKKILLIEDEENIFNAYKASLEEEGYELDVATDGKEGLEKIRKVKPNLILLDLILPVKDGFRVLEEIQKDDNLKDIPILILSNLGQDYDIEKGKKLGAIDYMVKANYSMQEVIERIEMHLGDK